MKKKILITGSCGFIASNLIRKILYLHKDQYDIASIDKLTSNNIANVYNNQGHSFNIADINDAHILNRIFQYEQPHIVIHAAAETDHQHTASMVQTNCLGTQNVINSSIKYGVEKIIYLSTDKVYGSLANESDYGLTENDQTNPGNLYAITKLTGEVLMQNAAKFHNLKYNIIRSSNNYGHRQNIHQLIPNTIRCIRNKQPIPVYGSGNQMRDWLHVFDHCDAILTILTQGEDNEIYNVASKQELTTLELVQKICNLMNEGHNLMTFVSNPDSHLYRYGSNSNKVKQLGWKPTMSLSQGLTNTIEWFQKNNWIYTEPNGE